MIDNFITKEDIKELELRTHIVVRSDVDGEKSYLIVLRYKKKTIKITPAESFPEHGSIIRNGSEGNGYHGICSNCGLALVTDLGYNSWDGKCIRKEKKETVVLVEEKLGWTKFKSRATRFTPKDALKYRWEKQNEQGWGKYNFHEVKI